MSTVSATPSIPPTLATAQPFTLDDYWRITSLNEMQLSPDGQRVAYVLDTPDREANERHAAIWLLDLASGRMRQLTSGAKRDTAPRWSPDGTRLAFISTREGGEKHLYVLPIDGGEPRRLTHLRHGVGDPFWGADGTWIGFEHEVMPGEDALAEIPSDPSVRERIEREEAVRPQVITRLVYRWDGQGYLTGRTHLFRVPADGGAVEQLTTGDYDQSEGACSPDGRYLAFLSDRSERRDANMAMDLWVKDLRTGEERRITDEHSDVTRLAWSPDSTRLAFLASAEVGAHSATNPTLRVADLATGKITDLTAQTDQPADIAFLGDVGAPRLSAPRWAPDGRALYLPLQRGGGSDLARVAADGSGITTLLRGAPVSIQEIALLPDVERNEPQAILSLQCDTVSPWNLWRYPLAAHGEALEAPTALTTINTDLFAARLASQPERFTFTSFDGQEIEAWLYPPVGANAKTPAPLILDIHGGPHGAFGAAIRLNVQILAGRGYAVLQINPRGSVGYGEAFLQACDRDWGGGDYRDLMAGLDAALARGGLDAKRLAVMGTSYGGYMTNWAITQTPRFHAAVSTYGISNLYSMFGTADMDPVWAQGDYGWPWERDEFFRERSPLFFADRVTTPLLLIGAEQDYRCPIGQCEEFYVWLTHRGQAPVTLVRLPKASHQGHPTPLQRIQRLELTFDWIGRYCPVE